MGRNGNTYIHTVLNLRKIFLTVRIVDLWNRSP